MLDFNRTPITLIIAAIAVALELVCTFDPARRSLYYNDLNLGIWIQLWKGAVWMPLTTTLLHGNLLHLAMNLTAWFAFAPWIERRFGPYRFLGLFVLLAYTSTLSQYCLAEYFTPIRQQSGVVGLSGVIFGLVGFLLIARRSEYDLSLVIGPQTLQWVGVWFIFCLLSTYAGWMRFANTAHAAGFVFGLVYGQAIYARLPQRSLWMLGATVGTLFLLSLMIACPGHPGYEIVRPWWRF